MSTTTDRQYLYRLGYHLQTRGLPDERIDDILSEAQAHSAHSGESLREAFGPPREYARRWDVAPAPRRWVRPLLFGVAGVVSGGALSSGAAGLVGGGVGPVLLVVLGSAVLIGAAAVIPLRDPVSACPRPPRQTVVLVAVALCVIIAGSGVLGAVR